MNFKQTKLAIGLSLLIILPSLVNAQNDDYEAGQKAMHAQQYDKAYEYFRKAESEKGYRDASLYWQSYVLYKNKQDAKARRTVEKLLKYHPNSKWVDDAEFLILEHELKHNSPNKMAKLKDELENARELQNKEFLEQIELKEELKLFAIQQLMFKDEAKGLKKLKKLLKNSNDLQIKMNALQLLGINESEQATKELYEFIRQNKVEQLQNQAVQMLSLRDSLKSHELLLNLYEKDANKQLKSSIIQGFIHSDNDKKLLELIEKEKDVDLSHQMIQMLGVKGASEELKKLSKTIKSKQNKAALIQALAISGDSQSIKDMIANNQDMEIKKQAIQSLIMVDDDLGSYLDDLYKTVKELELKQKIISVFIATGKNPKAIKSLIEYETNKELRMQLTHSLMAMDEKDELLSVLEMEKDPQAKLEIIHMLGAMGASEELKQLHKNSKDEEIQLEVIQALAITGSQNNEEFLNKTYESENRDVKNAVIQAYMIEGNTKALVQLLKAETDLEIKKNILMTISNIDPEFLLNSLENSN